jgi:hypothetical protein
MPHNLTFGSANLSLYLLLLSSSSSSSTTSQLSLSRFNHCVTFQLIFLPEALILLDTRYGWSSHYKAFNFTQQEGPKHKNEVKCNYDLRGIRVRESGKQTDTRNDRDCDFLGSNAVYQWKSLQMFRNFSIAKTSNLSSLKAQNIQD